MGPMPRVLLVVPTATYRAEAFLDAAARLRVEVTVASERVQALADLMGHRFLEVPLDDPEEAADRIVTLDRRAPLDAVVAVDDQGLLTAALAAARLGLAHNPPDAVAATRDKAALRRRLAAAEVPQPAFAALEGGDDLGEQAIEAADGIGLPVVVKPPGLSASRGVIRADDPAGVRAAARRVLRLLEHLCEPARLVVEAYVPGDEVALDGLLEDGRLVPLALFDKPDPLVGPYFEETLYVTPSRHPAVVQAQVIAVAQRAVTALGLVDGPVHAELRLPATAGGLPAPVVLEVAARTIGGRCSSALRFAAGASLEEIVLAHALRRPLPTIPGDGASGVMMLPIPASGRLVAVEGRDRAAKVPGITGVEVTVPVGSHLEAFPEGDRYPGFLFAQADTPAEVEAALRAAHGELELRIEPDQVAS